MYKLKIKECRKAKRISQKELSKKIGISQNFLSELENNKYPITLELLCKIAKALEMNSKDLYEDIYI